MLFAFKNMVRYTWISFSIILLILDSIEIGQVTVESVTIFLNIGITFAVFKAEGKFPVEKDILAIKRPGNFASLGKKSIVTVFVHVAESIKQIFSFPSADIGRNDTFTMVTRKTIRY